MAEDGHRPPRAELIKLADELRLMGHERQYLNAKQNPRTWALVPAVHGSARHALEVGEAAVRLVEGGRDLVAMTLMRAALESAVTASWLVASKEAIYGVVAEETRKRRLIARQMAEAASQVFRDGASQIAHVDDATAETIASAQARNFEQLCGTLTSGHEIYLHYRLMSALAHPGPALMDFYVDPDDDAPGGCHLALQPREHGHDAWLYITVVAMMLAQRALDHLTVDHPYRSRL